ncbi:hypothetical protein CVT25_003125, partial [Psilocybe cyanescens]
GTFKGLQNKTTGITSFLGIPFADAPVKDLRWRAPVFPPSSHKGTVDATKFAAACIRTTQTTVASETSEDCLFGNVYMPNNTHVGDDLPVLVWFHGGGFQSGNTHSFPPDFIMGSSSQPFVFASFEYRLGQFGFLGGSEIGNNGSLNAGLLDQRTTLKWVQTYIGLFGGDNSQVTIWGQSAGAGSILYHLMANGGDTEGLFHAAIAHSPPLTYTPLFNDSYDENIYQQFAQLAGCGSGGSDKRDQDTLGCLRKASSQTLARAGSKLLDARPDTLFVFAPVLDGSLITERPVEAYKAGRFAHVPIIAGSNTDEGSHWSSTITDPAANTSMRDATEDTVFNFLLGQYSNLTRDTMDTAFSFYPLEDYDNSFSLQGQQMYGETRYICSALMATPAVPAFGNYAYQYHYDNPHLGSNHESELKAFFGPPDNSDDEDLALFETMRQYWTSFVTSCKPVSFDGPLWHPVNGAGGSVRIFLNPQRIVMEQVDDALVSRCEFWHGITDETLT